MYNFPLPDASTNLVMEADHSAALVILPERHYQSPCTVRYLEFNRNDIHICFRDGSSITLSVENGDVLRRTDTTDRII
jgi:hypothetical protein